MMRTPDQTLRGTGLPVARLTATASPVIKRVPVMNRARPTTGTATGTGRTTDATKRMPPQRVMIKAIAKPRETRVFGIVVSSVAVYKAGELVLSFTS